MSGLKSLLTKVWGDERGGRKDPPGHVGLHDLRQPRPFSSSLPPINLVSQQVLFSIISSGESTNRRVSKGKSRHNTEAIAHSTRPCEEATSQQVLRHCEGCDNSKTMLNEPKTLLRCYILWKGICQHPNNAKVGPSPLLLSETFKSLIFFELF